MKENKSKPRLQIRKCTKKWDKFRMQTVNRNKKENVALETAIELQLTDVFGGRTKATNSLGCRLRSQKRKRKDTIQCDGGGEVNETTRWKMENQFKSRFGVKVKKSEFWNREWRINENVSRAGDAKQRGKTWKRVGQESTIRLFEFF